MTSKFTVFASNLDSISSNVCALKEVNSISYLDCGLACGTKLMTQKISEGGVFFPGGGFCYGLC